MENLEKIRNLGKGSFGNVHLVRDTRSNELFALKKVSCESQASKLNPINEVKLMSSLENVNVIKCFGYFQRKEKLYILMEFADDGDLNELVKEAKKTGVAISEKNILGWFTQICLALKYLHDKNILHRDIKLQNIFLMKTGLIKLGDFGISKKLENSTDLAQTSLGTPYYLSPELCSALPYGRKTDIWMLGCLLYELCALERPFSGDNISVLMNKILKEEPKNVPSSYSPLIHKLVANLLAKNQAKRPEIEDILQIREIKAEIRALAQKYPAYYKSLEEVYCKEEVFLQPVKAEPQKKKSLVRPLSYSNLPGIDNPDSNEKFSTPHNQKMLDKNDKNSILNVIKQAKKQTIFKPQTEEPLVQVVITTSNSTEVPFESPHRQSSNRVSFEQYLSNKLVVEKNEENQNVVVRKVPVDPIKSPLSGKLEFEFAPNKRPLKNLEIIDERTPNKPGGNFEEEEKRNVQPGYKNSISPTNFTKLKKNSPKGAGGNEQVSSQRYRLFVEFMKEKLGEEKFLKVKAVLQNEENGGGSGGMSEKKRNEVLEIIGYKNIEMLKYLGMLCTNNAENAEKRKGTIDSGDARDEQRVERTSSGYCKVEGLHRK